MFGKPDLNEWQTMGGKRGLRNRVGKMATQIGVLCMVVFFIISCGSSATTTSSQSDKQQGSSVPPDNGQRLYVNTPSGLTKLRAQDGKKLWQWTADASVDSGNTPVVSNGLVYVASGESSDGHGYTNGDIYAIDGKTGKIRWSTTFDDGITFLVDGNTLYVGSGHSVFALDAKTGQARWRKDVIFGSSLFMMSLVNNHVLYAYADIVIYAFDITDGTIQWQQNIDDLAQVPVSQLGSLRDMTLVNKTLVAMTSEGLLGINAHDGHKIWFDALEQKGYSFDTSKHLLYVMLSFGSSLLQNQTGLTAINTDDGSVAWTSHYPIDSNINGSLPMGFSSSTAYLGQSNQDGIQQVHAFSLKDGHMLWTADASPATNGVATSATPDQITTIIPGVTDQLYTIMNDGVVYALNATTGKQTWNLPAGVNDLVIGEPAHGGGSDLFISFSDLSTIELLNAKTGKSGWKQVLPSLKYGSNCVLAQE